MKIHHDLKEIILLLRRQNILLEKVLIDSGKATTMPTPAIDLSTLLGVYARVAMKDSIEGASKKEVEKLRRKMKKQ
jgi:hypothetical protein